MLLTLPDGDDRPLYQQIAAAVRRAIRDGELAAGDRLPPGRDLAEALDVNLDTVQRAYRLLVDDGLVVSRVGRGTRVVDPLPMGRLDLADDVDALVRRSRHLGVGLDDLLALVRRAASR